MAEEQRIYVVVQEGVLRHDIHGPYFNLEEARVAAQYFISKEKDDYHGFIVGILRPTEDIHEVQTLSRKKSSPGISNYDSNYTYTWTEPKLLPEN